MKTISIFSTLIAVLFINLNIANAQSEVLNASVHSVLTDSDFQTEAAPAPTPVDVAPHYRVEVLSVDLQNGSVQLNYELSGFTNNATLQIQDFTGRTLKSFKVNTLNPNSNEFQISDLLAGTYKYILIVDNQKKLAGEFTLNEF